MPLLAGDIAAAKEEGLLPEGTYVATVKDANEKMRPDGFPRWEVDFETSEGEMREFIHWTRKAAYRGKLMCEALGIDLTNPTPWSTPRT